MAQSRPGDWVDYLLKRFDQQLPIKTGLHSHQSLANIEQNKACLVSVSSSQFVKVITGLAKTLRDVDNTKVFPEAEANHQESQIIILDTLEQCLNLAPKDAPNRFDEAMFVKHLLPEICRILNYNGGDQNSSLVQQRQYLASKVLFALSVNNFGTVFSRITNKLSELEKSSSDESTVNTESDLDLIMYIKFDHQRLIKLFTEVIRRFTNLKKNIQLILADCIEKAIWSWMDAHPDEFSAVHDQTTDELSECCDKLFELFYWSVNQSSSSQAGKKKLTFYPTMMMLLLLCPKALREIVYSEQGGIQTNNYKNKKAFYQEVRRAVTATHGYSKNIMEASVVTFVKLCKAATFVNMSDRANVLFQFVWPNIDIIKSILFNPSRPFSRGQNYVSADFDLMVDCFVAMYRIDAHHTDIVKICINPNAPTNFHHVLVCALHRIIAEPRLSWWPKADVVYGRAFELRKLFTETLQKLNLPTNFGSTKVPQISNQSAAGGGGRGEMNILERVKDKKLMPQRNSEEAPGNRFLLFWLIKLIRADPKVVLFNEGERRMMGHEVQDNTRDIVGGLVSVIQGLIFTDCSQGAMQALLCLHHAEHIFLWNPIDPINAFWELSSRALAPICQALIQNQTLLVHQRQGSAIEYLKWVHELVTFRLKFLQQHRDQSCQALGVPTYRMAHNLMEVLFFIYLWSSDIDAIQTALSCFQLLCEEADIRHGSDEVLLYQFLPNYEIYSELAAASESITTGRAALQKKVVALLRRVSSRTTGNQQAWLDTFKIWEFVTKYLRYSPAKSKYEEGGAGGLGEPFPRGLKRRISHLDHEIEDQLTEWANQTGFLCSLGAICLDNRDEQITSPQMTRMGSFYSQQQMFTRRATLDDVRYCPVSQFIGKLLQLLVCQNEKYAPQMQKTIKDVLGQELNLRIYPTLVNLATVFADKCFDISGQVQIGEQNTMFVESVIYIMRKILDGRGPSPAAATVATGLLESEEATAHTEELAAISLEPLVLSLVRYVRHMEPSVQRIQLQTKACNLVRSILSRRDELMFRQEIRFRNQLVDYLSDWVMANPSSAPSAISTTPKTLPGSQDLEVACMEAVSMLLSGLPIQPEEGEYAGDVMDAKSQLYAQYFTVFLNLVNECSEISIKADRGRRSPENIQALRKNTISAMSNLLSANIDCGLKHSISLGYHSDSQTRAAFMEVLTKILHEGAEFETLADTALTDRYERLVELVTMIGDKGDLPIAMALAHVVTSAQMDEFAKVLVNIFDGKHLLQQLLWNTFSKEAESTDCLQTLFRGNSLASKIMSRCFHVFGQSYLVDLFRPILIDMYKKTSTMSYEIDPVK